MPKPFPKEFRADVIAVARQGDQSVAQVARSFGVSESCLQRWLKIADREDRVSGPTSSPAASSAGVDLEAENRELRKRAKQLEQENEILRRATAYFARDVPPKMMYPLVQDLAADKIPVAVTCRVLGFSKQAFYKWQADPVSQRDWDDAHLINAAIDIHHDDPGFGYRFITDELAEQGVRASRNRVNRLCSSQRLWSVHSRKRGLNRKPGPPVHDDLVLRHFTAEAPNRLWLTDITEHPTAEGKLYLCAVKDACSKRIVGYSIDARMTSDLAVNALSNALALRGPVEAIVHSDRGSQFRSHAYVRALRDAQLRGSMGRVGACADNAAMESFFSLLQKNVLNRQRWTTRDQLRLAIVIWIEKTYHRRRRQDALGRMTTIEFETLTQAAHAA
ncbi:IS3 family transposase [Modestobacter sp. VKM Ac-2979]|uniref:IS3 family transposase n=1 Tax=unclassified Modestobacter TaxID=2643866 RepID=UPI0022AB5F87|nr:MULTISPECIES: IS3 family transposase [unclassified Modestobacter]MCZ2810229.1 IS3 family transposase [Modestobacter sp. VKM Ac-2979]MCZ2841715.1 IS3 family transposase [Modestobacter sp. VKM Ac-2980]